ncbi:hypothetical protein BT63DRAFT_429468 [Microthyrium microscopicum]|uniref:Uncharacterized protein n=1 Tax=Microthyrium microscopicum TaxID=703497 RepID=A0A6A6TZW7_9PEZI|nr:hypothetical protein BT63DRAFT_429468 [Microthyrium microscopicum]
MNLDPPPTIGNETKNEIRQETWTALKSFALNHSLKSEFLVDILLDQMKLHSIKRHNVYDFFEPLAFSILWLAKQETYSKDNDDRIASAIIRLQETSDPKLRDPQCGVLIHSIFAVYCCVLWDAPLDPPYGDRADAHWSDTERDGQIGSPKKEPNEHVRMKLYPGEWTNINSFMAHLVSFMNPEDSRLPRGDCVTFRAFRTTVLPLISDALEHYDPPELLDTILPAALCWIVYAGTLLRRLAWPEYFHLEPSSGREWLNPGPLYKGNDMIAEGRWMVWHERLVELEKSQKLAAPTQYWVTRAVAAMTEIESRIPAAVYKKPRYKAGWTLNRPLSPE